MCGIAMIRLLKPLDYYQKKYDSWQYGLNKMYLLMEKQHNWGAGGAGIATLKLDITPGRRIHLSANARKEKCHSANICQHQRKN